MTTEAEHKPYLGERIVMHIGELGMFTVYLERETYMPGIAPKPWYVWQPVEGTAAVKHSLLEAKQFMTWIMLNKDRLS